jgi:hypothetical protein
MKDIKIDKIIRSKRKTISLGVTPDATLVVRAPFDTSVEKIQELVIQKRFWIKEKMVAVKKNGITTDKEFENGEGFLFLGKSYKLKIQDCDKIELSGGLCLPKKYKNNAREKLIEWYREKALEKITERVEWYSKNTGWRFKSVKINDAKSRWGSCGASGSLNFTWRLIMAPIAIVDYVVVHEMAHIQEKGHSKKFWNRIKTILPDYEQREKWLKENRKFLNV